MTYAHFGFPAYKLNDIGAAKATVIGAGALIGMLPGAFIGVEANRRQLFNRMSPEERSKLEQYRNTPNFIPYTNRISNKYGDDRYTYGGALAGALTGAALTSYRLRNIK